MNQTRRLLWGVAGAAVGSTVIGFITWAGTGGVWLPLTLTLMYIIGTLTLMVEFRKEFSKHYTPALLSLLADGVPRDASACEEILYDFDGRKDVMIHVLLGKLVHQELVHGEHRKLSTPDVKATLGAYVYTLTPKGLEQAESEPTPDHKAHAES